MSTAATTIIKFLEAKTKDDWEGVSFLTLLKCIGEIEDSMVLWGKRGVEVDSFTGTIRRTRRQLASRFDNELLSPFDPAEVGNGMESSDLTVLRWIDEKLSNTALRFDEGKFSEILAMLTQTKAAIVSDDTLSDELRVFILRILSQAEQALSEYGVTGDFNLAEAMTKLSGAINIVKAHSKKPGIWEKLRDNVFFPIAVGIMTRAPFEALDVIQMFALESGSAPASETRTG